MNTELEEVKVMAARNRNTTSPLSPVSVIVSLMAIVGLFTAVSPATPQVYFHSPTATYSAYLSINYTGSYHYVDAQPLCGETFPPCLVASQPVFYLSAENGTLIQLVFYCGQYYCNLPQQLPFSDGTRIHVQGTLLVPSRWPTNKYLPTLQFIADLYVFNYTAST